MSEIWEECERKIEELKEKLPKEVTQDKDILNSVLQKKLKELKKGKIVGNPEIEELKVKEIKYVIPIRPTNKNLGILVGIIAKDENVSELSYRTNWDGRLESISAYKKHEPFLYVYTVGERIYVSCYKKEASRIVDKIETEFGLSNHLNLIEK